MTRLLIIKAAQGFRFILCATQLVYVEWPLEPGGAPIFTHPHRPRAAKWLKADESPNGKQGMFLENEDETTRIDTTLFAHSLICEPNIEPFPATIAFKSTSLNDGYSLERLAPKAKSVDGLLKGNVVGLWRASSLLVKEGTFAWFKPVMTVLGTLGQESGPTLAQVRQATELRQAFRETHPTAQPAPAIEGPRGSITVTSGRQPAVDPNLNDPVPF